MFFSRSSVMVGTTEDSGLREAYARANHETRISESKIGATIAFVGVPAGIVLDWFVYPDRLLDFAIVRSLAALLIGLCLLFHYTVLGRNTIELLTFSWLVTVQIAICLMIFQTDGFASTYYAGLNLAIVAMGILLPTSVLETAGFCVLTMIMYLLAGMTAPAATAHDSSIVFNNFFFLVLTSVIGTTAVYFNLKRRFIEFSLRFELDDKNRKLAELDRRKTHFFANISHELRTPLTLILAPVQEVLEGGNRLPNWLVSRLELVRNNALRLLKLVNDLLDVLRMEEGKIQLEQVPVDVNFVVQGMADGMMHLSESKGILMVKQLCSEPLFVRGDHRALEKVIVNLVNNAIKFTPQGGRITVRSQQESGKVMISVVDTGIGIPPEEQPYIFDRFHQVDSSSTRRFRGTGLGLALVKEITENMGGRIRVESKLGEGTAMTLTLPLSHATGEFVEEDGDEDALERLHRLADYHGGLTVENIEEPRGSSHVANSDSRPTILIVEDEPDMRRYLAHLLEGEYRVRAARTGTEGLQLVSEDNPDLVLLDVMLPEVDGLEICRRIRQERLGGDPKIMLLTARADEQSKLTALEHGANDFLTKPFSSVEVKTRLRNLYLTAKLERELLARNDSLQKALRDLELTQAQLIHSEKLNALGTLAAGLLHEINNPLNYSLTALQLLRRNAAGEGNELMREVLGDIDEGMQRVRGIVTDLRAFAYPSEGGKHSPFDVREAVESALRFTSHELKGVNVVVDLPDDTQVVAAKNHITQVLVNLLTNAAHAIKDVGSGHRGEIRIAGAVKDGRLSVAVADNGAGMDEAILGRIFDPFFTTREVGDGMGLGLSICHTIVANHGGRILVESRRGEGTRMVFDLPIEGKTMTNEGLASAGLSN